MYTIVFSRFKNLRNYITLKIIFIIYFHKHLFGLYLTIFYVKKNNIYWYSRNKILPTVRNTSGNTLVPFN